VIDQLAMVMVPVVQVQSELYRPHPSIRRVLGVVVDGGQDAGGNVADLGRVGQQGRGAHRGVPSCTRRIWGETAGRVR
jgi:hypothetical protein